MASLPDIASSQDKLSGPSLPSGPDLELLLVGKTGHGKSATGNSILGDNIFPSDDSTNSVTSTTAMFEKKMDGRKLLLVDTPGLADTGIDDIEQARIKAEGDFSRAISLSPEGFHAILLVFAYGQRMTREEVEAIKELKSLLGENFIKDHGILLITHGDDFERKFKGKKSFNVWCGEQTSYMETVLQECQNRCLLFDNEGDDDRLKRQRFELVQMIDRMTGGKRYDEGIFKEIKAGWKSKGNPKARKAYLDSCQIYSDIKMLIKEAQVHDQKFVDRLRLKIKDLKIATKYLTGSSKKEVDEKIKECEEKLKQLEIKIKSSKDGYVKKGPEIDAIIAVVGTTLVLLTAPFSGTLAMIGAAVLATWAVIKATVTSVKKKKCVIQ